MCARIAHSQERERKLECLSMCSIHEYVNPATALVLMIEFKTNTSELRHATYPNLLMRIEHVTNSVI